MGNAIGVFDFIVAREAVKDERQTLVAFDIAGTLEIFIERGADQIL